MIRLVSFLVALLLAGLVLVDSLHAQKVDLEQLKKHLRDANPAVRVKALDALNANSKFIKDVADEVFALSKDSDPTVRRRAMSTLENMFYLKVRAEEAQKLLRERFKDSDEEVRLAAVRAALYTVASFAAPEGVPVLIEIIRKRKAGRAEPLSMLRLTGEHGKAALPELVDAIKNGDGREMTSATGTMMRLKLDLKPVLPDLAKRVGTKLDPHDMESLAHVLAKHDMPEATQAIRPLVLTPGHGTRTQLIFTEFYRQSPELVMRTLVPLLKDPEPKVRVRAVLVVSGLETLPRTFPPDHLEKMLQDLAASSKELVPNLRANLKEKDEEVRWFSAIALARSKVPEAREAVPLAVEWLKQDPIPPIESVFNATNRGAVIFLVDPERAASLTFDAMATADGLVRDRFAQAAWILPDATLQPHLAKALDKGNENQKAYAVGVLRQLVNYRSPGAIKSYVPALDKLLDAPEAAVRLNVASLLTAQSKGQERVIAVASKALDEKDPALRRQAVDLLFAQGKDATSARPPLLRALGDMDLNVRLQAAYALVNLDATKAEPVLPVLKKFLETPDPAHVQQVFGLLTRLGPRAEPVLPPLVAIVEDKDSKLRLFAAMTMLRVDPKRTEPAARAVQDAIASPNWIAEDGGYVIDTVRLLGPAGKVAQPALQQAYDNAKNQGDKISFGVTLITIDSSDKNPALGYLRPLLAGKGKQGFEDQLDMLDELKTVGRSAKVFLPELIDLVKNESDSGVLRWSIQVLGNVGPEAKSALPQLEALAKSTKNASLRNLLQKSITSINGK